MRTLSQFSRMSKPVKQLFFKKVVLQSSSTELKQIFETEPHLLFILNHGHMFGPVVSLLGLHDILVQHGAGERRVLSVTLKLFYKFPIIRNFAQFVTQSPKSLNVEQLLSKITNNEVDDILIMPEGENGGYGNGNKIEPFISPRFVEISIRSNTPILLAVHRGTHFWMKHYPKLGNFMAQLPHKTPWLPERRRKSLQQSGINLTRLRMGRLRDYPWTIQLHRPNITAADFALADPRQQKKIIEKEAAIIHKKMVEAFAKLPDPTLNT